MSLHKLLLEERLTGNADEFVRPESYMRWSYDFGGGSTQTGTSQTIVNSEPFGEQKSHLVSGFNRAESLLNTPRQFAPFETVVPFANQTETGLRLAEARALEGSPLTDAAQEQALSTIQGDFVNADNPAFDIFSQQIASDVGNQINSQFAAANRLGSSANAEALGRGVAAALSPLAFQNFQTERANQLAATQLAPGLANIDFNNIDRLLSVGAQREGQEGARIQDQIDRFNFQQNEPRERLREFLANVSGGQFRQTTTSQPIFENRTANRLGTAATLAGIGGELFDIFG